MRTVLSIHLPENPYKRLDSFAKETGRNKSDVVRESVNFYLWEKRFEKAKSKIKPLAKKAGVIAEEDVFEHVS
ncbi:ribbon-helix-helix domain-containing protein [Hippea sp. KM1]|uniref:ribbon-helix-helix domain-containing protein n=1 Tax=Hippea sp. KM1 TaxID=944481 RepID=UPI00046D0C9A|nr:ribbon-helix-helix domain-containing protein [Hippea sp. KM1]